MSWVTILWSVSAGISLGLGVIHLLAWMHDRKAASHLFFFLSALSATAFTFCDLSILQARDKDTFLLLYRLWEVPFFLLIVSLSGFVASYFRTGRPWLLALLVGMRVVVLVLNFISPAGFNYLEVSSMQAIHFLGEEIYLPQAVPTPWILLGETSGTVFLIYVLDAAFSLYRKGKKAERRRALVVGGSMAVAIFLAVMNSLSIHVQGVHAPFFVSFFFLLIVSAMGLELSRDIYQASALAAQIRENAESMASAARSARLALWRWDIARNLIWVSPHGRSLYGIAEEETVTLESFLDTVHPEDREMTQSAITASLHSAKHLSAEYRIVLPEGGVLWIAARGEIVRDAQGNAVALRGVSLDATRQKEMEQEAVQHRAELAHLTRVTTLSELSGSLAHELNQPLAIILSNAQAAQRFLKQSPPNVEEALEILRDIVSEDRRAGEVIHRLRALLKRGETHMLPLSLEQVADSVLQLTRAEFINRGVSVSWKIPPGELEANIRGDQVQLQQVILNLLLNGADAMAANPPGSRRLHMSTAVYEARVRLEVHDEGCGLPADAEKLFEPFFTMKPHGLGMGLAICRSIIHAHGGRIWAESLPRAGAVFYIEFPCLPAPAH